MEDAIVVKNVLAVIRWDARTIQKLAETELQEISDTKAIQTKRNEACMTMYEIWVCLQALQNMGYKIDYSAAPLLPVCSFRTLRDRLIYMVDLTNNLQDSMDGETAEDMLQQLYGVYICCYTFIESKERSKETPYPPMTVEQQRRVKDIFYSLLVYSLESKVSRRSHHRRRKTAAKKK